MARPRKFDEPLSGAERTSRWRERKAKAKKKKTKKAMLEELERSMTNTREKQAKVIHSSVRTVYRILQIERYKAIDWIDVIRGDYGRVGISLVADICYRCDEKDQRFMHNLIKKKGAAAARQVWRTHLEMNKSE